MDKIKKKPVGIVGLLAIICFSLWQAHVQPKAASDDTTANIFYSEFINSVDARKERLEDVQAYGSGTVVSLLPDDTKGSRHQRILVQEADGETILVVHNIDLAPRIDDIKIGDNLEYFGEYIWNAKGGLIHWTHHDPNGRHVDGWIKHNGNKYE